MRRTVPTKIKYQDQGKVDIESSPKVTDEKNLNNDRECQQYQYFGATDRSLTSLVRRSFLSISTTRLSKTDVANPFEEFQPICQLLVTTSTSSIRAGLMKG